MAYCHSRGLPKGRSRKRHLRGAYLKTFPEGTCPRNPFRGPRLRRSWARKPHFLRHRVGISTTTNNFPPKLSFRILQDRIDIPVSSTESQNYRLFRWSIPLFFKAPRMPSKTLKKLSKLLRFISPGTFHCRSSKTTTWNQYWNRPIPIY